MRTYCASEKRSGTRSDAHRRRARWSCSARVRGEDDAHCPVAIHIAAGHGERAAIIVDPTSLSRKQRHAIPQRCLVSVATARPTCEERMMRTYCASEKRSGTRSDAHWRRAR